MKRIFQGSFWISLYLLITFLPLIILLVGPRPIGRELWRDFSVGLGFCSFSMLGLQFFLTARIKAVKAPFGSDIVYYFHHQISRVMFILIALHPIILFIFNPTNLQLLNLITAPWAARFGVSAILLMGGLIGLSIWRKRIKIEYDRWRIWHGILAIAAMTFALVHIELRGYYLNTLWKQIFWGLYGLFWIGVMAWVRVIKPLILLKKEYFTEQIIRENGNAHTIILRVADSKGFKFQPGQFAWITIWDSPFQDHEHPFSISSSAMDRSKISFTIKDLGDFTGRIKQISIGQRVYVDGPYGAFSIDRYPRSREFVFIAGGIGITPFMSMLRTSADRGDQRAFTLIYANKNIESTTFLEEINSMTGKINLKFILVLEAPPVGWTGEIGFVNSQILKRYLPVDLKANQVKFFVCGPLPMMDAVEKALYELKIPLSDINSERFDLV